MKNKVGSYTLVVDPFLSDCTGHLSLGALGNHFLNCAGFHANERGFGFATLNEHNCTWVLSRLVVELSNMPMQYEHFTVETWVENVYRMFTDRDFALYGADGTPYGYARSVWAMIDLDSRKPVDLLSINDGSLVDYIEAEKECPIEKPGRIKVNQHEPVRTIPIQYSDIDINGHVNSIKYIEHILNLFPLDWHRSHRVTRFEIAYVAETYYEDTLSFFEEVNEDGSYGVELRKNAGGEKPEGEVVCRSKIKFDNK